MPDNDETKSGVLFRHRSLLMIIFVIMPQEPFVPQLAKG